MANIEDAEVIACLENARDATLQTIRNDFADCSSNPATIAELANRVNAINTLLAFLKVK